MFSKNGCQKSPETRPQRSMPVWERQETIYGSFEARLDITIRRLGSS